MGSLRPAAFALAAFAAASAAPLSDEARDRFQERGYHVAPGLLQDEAPALIEEMQRLMDEASAEDEADWSDGGDAPSSYSVSYQPDAATGAPIAGRIFKLQAVATRSRVMKERTILNEKLVAVAEQLLGVAADEAMDAFGTKFFPLLPAENETTSTSTSFHDDTHFFGTASDRVLSMSLYLEDTDVENGCLRVVPGSHANYGDGVRREGRYARGTGAAAHGEWLELEADERAVDVVVPAGTPVFFDGRLIHGARHNVSPERSSFRIIAHFVPADLPMAWRGVDFGRGYADRYEVKAPALVGALTSEL